MPAIALESVYQQDQEARTDEFRLKPICSGAKQHDLCTFQPLKMLSRHLILVVVDSEITHLSFHIHISSNTPKRERERERAREREREGGGGMRERERERERECLLGIEKELAPVPIPNVSIFKKKYRIWKDMPIKNNQGII